MTDGAKPTKQEAQSAVNTIKDLLLTSNIVVRFPLEADLVMDFKLTRQCTRKQFKLCMEVLALAEDSCVAELVVPEPTQVDSAPSQED